MSTMNKKKGFACFAQTTAQQRPSLQGILRLNKVWIQYRTLSLTLFDAFIYIWRDHAFLWPYKYETPKKEYLKHKASIHEAKAPKD